MSESEERETKPFKFVTGKFDSMLWPNNGMICGKELY